MSPQAVTVGPVGVTPVVYVTTGLNFPDALGASRATGIGDAPVLLVKQNSIPPSTQTELIRLQSDTIVIAGGTGVVSSAVETALGGYAATVERNAGFDRCENRS